MRWRLRLEEYDYEIEYKKGKENGAADALSRMYLPPPLPPPNQQGSGTRPICKYRRNKQLKRNLRRVQALERKSNQRTYSTRKKQRTRILTTEYRNAGTI